MTHRSCITTLGTLTCARDCDALMKGIMSVSNVIVMGQLDLERTNAWLDPTTLDFKIQKLSLLGAGKFEAVLLVKNN